MKLLNFSIIKLTLCLILGILLAHNFNLGLSWSFRGLVFIGFVLSISFFIAKYQFKNTNWFGILSLSTMVIIGVVIYNVHHQKHFRSHYTNHITQKKDTPITFRIRETLKSNLYYNKYVVDVLKIEDQNVTGKVLLNVKKDSIQTSYRVDDILLSYSELKPIQTPLNPNQFNYKAYLEKQYIYHQLITSAESVFMIESSTHTLFGFAESLRKRINIKLKQHKFKPNELAIINALILGQRQDINPEIYNNYVDAGAIHILAVSGLHVGILLFLLNWVLKPIEYLKKGKLTKVLLILVFLWSFVIVAGLSASVTRAVTMFSIVAIAMHLKRPTNIYNTLAISVFFLLLFKPMFLFDVGFQMSYLAVIAIVSIQPLLYKLWQQKLKITDYLWQIFTVTIAAQFGVVPISLYYFHQFPGLFLVSNMILIPFLGLILGLGILVIILALANALPSFLAIVYETIIKLMNQLVDWTSNQDAFLIKDISFSALHVITSYILIFLFIKLIHKRDYFNLRIVLITIILFQIGFIINRSNNSNQEFIIFNKSRFSILGYRFNSSFHLAHNFDSITKVNDKTIKAYKIEHNIKTIIEDTLQSVYSINEKTLLLVDSLGVYNVKAFRPDYVLLRHSPRVNLIRLIDSLQPKLIIADGSNYKSYAKRWKATCERKKIPFHNTSEKGAYFIK